MDCEDTSSKQTSVVENRAPRKVLSTAAQRRQLVSRKGIEGQRLLFWLRAAGSVTGDESKLFSPFGTKPNYTDMQQVSFDNANEKAVGGSLAYDFGKLGAPGLSTGAWYTHGWDAFNPGTALAIPNRDELDLWIQYRPTEGPLKGFRLKTQYSDVWQDGNMRNPQPEFRFIADYTILFRN